MGKNFKRFLSWLMVLTMVLGMMPATVLATESTETTQSNLVAWYDFNGVDGTTVKDETGNGNNATLINGASIVADERAGYGCVMELAGGVKGSSAPGLSLPTEMFKSIDDVTIIMDVKLDSFELWSCLLNAGVSGQQLKYMTFVNQAAEGGPLGISNATSHNGNDTAEKRIAAVAGTQLPTNEWGRVALRHVASTNYAEIYLDNVLVAEGYLDVTLQDLVQDAGCEVRIGSNNIWTDPGLDGKVDNIRIYNKALTVEEMEAIPSTAIDTEEELKAALVNGGEIYIGGNITTDEILVIDKDTTIYGNGYTITGTAGKVFEVKNVADEKIAVTIETWNIVNTAVNGRCVDTRSDYIDLKLKNCTLTAVNGNSQPLTIGGSHTAAGNLIVDVYGCAINAGASGYGIIAFVPVWMNVADNNTNDQYDSSVSGYGCLYMKDGSADSQVRFDETALTATNGHSGGSDDFGAIVLEDQINLIFVEDSCQVKVAAEGTATQYVLVLEDLPEVESEADPAYIEIDCPVTLSGSNTRYETGLDFVNADVYFTDEDAIEELKALGYELDDYNRLTGYTDPSTLVAQVGETKYDSLAKAVEAANALDTATVKLLKDVTLGKSLTISGDVTIEGAYTISRGDYAGNLFTVSEGAKLTLDGGLVIDGGNEWVMNSEAYYADMQTNTRKHPYATAEAGAPVATNTMIDIVGTVVMNSATIQNNYGSSVFYVADGAALTMNNGATVTHNYKNGSSVVADVFPGGTWTMNTGSKVSGNYSSSGNGALSYMKGTMIMNGGEICGNFGASSGMIMIYSSSDDPAKFATFTMNGGSVCHNAAFGGGWGSVIYVHYSDRVGYDRGGTFTMNGGTIEANKSYLCTTIVGNSWSSHIFLNGGTIKEEASYGGYYTNYAFEMTIGKDLTISGGRVRTYADTVIDGTVESDLDLYGTGISKGEDGLWDTYGTGMTVSGSGTVKGKVRIGGSAIVTITSGTYLGDLEVRDGGKLTLTGGTFSLDVNEYCADGYYAMDNGNGTWTVVKGIPVTVTFDDVTMVEGNPVPEFTYTTNFSEVAEDGTMLVVGKPEVTIDGAGEYKITANAYVFMNEDYIVTVVPGTLTVEEAVAEVDGVNYASLQEAINAATSGETVKLLKDITYTDADKVHPSGANTGYDKYGQYYNCIIYTAGTQGATAAENTPSLVNAVLDLNGHTITNTAEDTFLFILMDNTKLTITGEGSINNGNYPAIWTTGTDTLLTVKSGKLTTTGTDGVIHVTHASDMVITGGEFDSTAAEDSALIWRNEQTYNNANSFQVGAATVTITGGTFYGFNPEQTPDDYKEVHYFNAVAQGYEAVQTQENVWTVNPDYVAEVNGVKYTSIQAAINAVPNNTEEPVTVKVLKDHTISAENSASNIVGVYWKNMVLDLNGKTVTFDYTQKTNSATVYTSIYVYGSGLTITGNGTLYNKGLDQVTTNESRIMWVATNAIATIENGTFISDQKDTMFYTSCNTSSATRKTELHVKGGTFQQLGSFVNSGVEYHDCFNMQDNSASWQIIELTGGTFNEHPKTGFQNSWEVTIPEGYAVVDNGDGTWSVNPCITVTMNDVTMVEGNQVPELTYTVDYGYVPEGTVNVTVSDISVFTAPEAGEYDITATATLTNGTGKAENYTVQVIKGKLTVLDAVAQVDGVNYASIRDAVANAKTGDTVVVLKDHEMDVSEVTANAPVYVDGSKIESLTIDLNGKNITAYTNKNSGNVWSIFYAVNGADLTITGDGALTVYGDDSGVPYVFWASAAKLTVQNGTYKLDASTGAVAHTFYASNGASIAVQDGFYGLYNSKDPVSDLMNTKDNTGSTITVTGGTYTEYFPNTNQPEEITIPEGYAIVDNGDGTWSVIRSTVHVKFDFNGGANSHGMTAEENDMPYGSTFTLADPNVKGTPKREGYTCTSFNTKADGTGTKYDFGTTLTFTEDITLYAQWQAKKFTITWDFNGGTNDNGMTQEVTPNVTYGTEITLPAVVQNGVTTIVRDGYVCTGFNTAADGSGTAYAFGDTVTITGDITLYAQWTEAVARNGSVYYATLQDAYDDAAHASYVIALKDIVLTETLVCDEAKQVYFKFADGGKYNLSGDLDTLIQVDAGVVYISSGSDIRNTGDVFYVTGGRLTVYGTAKITSEEANCVYVRGGITTIEKAILVSNGEYPAIQGNGNYVGDVTIGLKSGVPQVSAPNSDMAIYWPGNGTLSINGGVIKGDTAVYVKSGKLNIKGGEFYGTGDKANFVHNSNGAYATGDAVVIENCKDAAYETPVVSISGGKFVSTNAEPVAVYNCNTENAPIQGFITGGTYNKDVTDDLVAEGYYDLPDAKGEWWSIAPEGCVLTVDGVWFKSFDDAKASIKKNSAIVLYADVESNYNVGCTNDYKFPSGGSITMELNGFCFHSVKPASGTTTITINANTTLTITDSVGTGSIIFDNKGHPLVLSNNAKLYLPETIDFQGTIQLNYTNGQVFLGEECVLGQGGAVQTNGWGNNKQYNNAYFNANGDITLGGGSFTLTKDFDLFADRNVVVPKGVTLDLAGNDLTVKSLSVSGTVIDSTDGQGSITVSDRLWFNNHDNGGYLPIKDGDVYRLYATELSNLGARASGANKCQYGFRIVFTNVDAYTKLAANLESGMLTAEATWTDGLTGSLADSDTWEWNDANLRGYLELAASNPKAAITMTLDNSEHISGDVISGYATIATSTGVVISSEAVAYTIP